MTDPESDLLDGLDLDDTERKALEDGTFSAEQVAHAHWYADEAQRCRDALAPILLHVRRQDDLQLVRHGISTDASGTHEVSLTFEVDGGAWTNDDRETREVYCCGGCERVFEEAATHDPDGEPYDEERCPRCGTHTSHEWTEVTTVVF